LVTSATNQQLAAIQSQGQSKVQFVLLQSSTLALFHIGFRRVGDVLASSDKTYKLNN